MKVSIVNRKSEFLRLGSVEISYEKGRVFSSNAAKPFMIAEMATAEDDNGTKADWIKDAFY